MTLDCDTVYTKPISYDWSDHVDSWQSWEVATVVLDVWRTVNDEDSLEQIEVPVLDGGVVYGGRVHHTFDDYRRWGGAVIDTREEFDTVLGDIEEEYGEGPAMNYYYPLPDTRWEPIEAATKIADLPLCVVQLDDGDLALALTGGGMDLSWEICEAFLRLGYMPPLHFCDLPRMAGHRSPREQEVIAACLTSANWAAKNAEHHITRLNDLRVDYALNRS